MSDRVKLTAEELDAMMPEGEYVHTLMGGGFAVVGCDRKRSELLEYAAKGQAELAGATAKSMGHGAAVSTEDGFVFVATIEKEEAAT
jgi:hypothetical protein